MVTITLDPDYGYVILAATSTFILNLVHGINTGTYRKAAKIDYPAAYAPSSRTDADAHRFNCAQRSHANFTENHSVAVTAMLVSGLQFPRTAAVLGGFWSLSRWAYMRGYSRGGAGGKGRYEGIAFWGFQLGLMGMCGWMGGEDGVGGVCDKRDVREVRDEMGWDLGGDWGVIL
ncbi:putative Microsomal glutathione S-transferase 3 [Sclerotinia borealis F-4128]|uniref:Putative Microsomal glutathione S-transferase 3 n=1 Tax=Sclerotinia borealis (strain F-4128) TaxID=1432307 RepID=W9CK47_SCLBF|nr:putative Microsomal glutathione S-transferase 3 [Sclerotinia borealis F-4128]